MSYPSNPTTVLSCDVKIKLPKCPFIRFTKVYKMSELVAVEKLARSGSSSFKMEYSPYAKRAIAKFKKDIRQARKLRRKRRLELRGNKPKKS